MRSTMNSIHAPTGEDLEMIEAIVNLLIADGQNPARSTNVSVAHRMLSRQTALHPNSLLSLWWKKKSEDRGKVSLFTAQWRSYISGYKSGQIPSQPEASDEDEV